MFSEQTPKQLPILVHIITPDTRQTDEIITLLLAQKLLINATVSEHVMHQKNEESGKVESNKHHLTTGKTKGLLFNQINMTLLAKYLDNMPTIFSSPIIYMNEAQALHLRLNTAKV